jgi:hypothetical protein
MTEEAPLIEFCRLLPEARAPKRADRSGAGLIPSRAMRYCEALTTATGYGFWIFPPIDLRFLFDGEQVWWSYGDDESWLPLSATASKAVQFPGFSEMFDASAPEYLRGCSPPFISAMPETGGVQIWTGLLAKTRPGWSLAVRPPVNLPPIAGLATWEGVVETDIWFGPLFSNFQITKTDIPVFLRAEVPFLQVQPLPQIAYSDDAHASCIMGEAASLSADEWDSLSQVLLPSPDPEARQGSYAVTVRKRRLSG